MDLLTALGWAAVFIFVGCMIGKLVANWADERELKRLNRSMEEIERQIKKEGDES